MLSSKVLVRIFPWSGRDELACHYSTYQDIESVINLPLLYSEQALPPFDQ